MAVLLFADVDGDWTKGHAHNQTITLPDNTGGTAFGDATGAITGNARGGDDTLNGGAYASVNFYYGDSFDIIGHGAGGNDTVVGGTTRGPTTCTATVA